jgi:cytochrome bd-type quinol oxidase subunit 1
MDALLLHRIHFAFTVTYHYLFPQLTMGLALLIVVLKTIAIHCKDEPYNEAARCLWVPGFCASAHIILPFLLAGASCANRS